MLLLNHWITYAPDDNNTSEGVHVRVSVIIAAYNVEYHISRALESLRNQTYPDWEAIVVNDCSTDNTVGIVNALALSEPRIQVVTLDQNGGPAAARNAGFKYARGAAIAVLDADDAYTATRIEDLMRVMQDHDADVVMDNMYLFDDATRSVVKSVFPEAEDVQPLDAVDIIESENFKDRLKYGFFKPLFRRSFLVKNSLIYDSEIRLAEDFFLLSEIALTGGKIFLYHKPGYIYTTQYGLNSGFASTGSRTQVRYYDRVLIADRLIAKYSKPTQPNIRNLLKLYRRWMLNDYIIITISQKLKTRDLRVAKTMFLNPTATLKFIASSRTAARLKNFFYAFFR